MEDLVAAYRLLVADVYELAGASRRSSDELAAAVGHTAARWHVMSAVSDAPATVPDVARRLGQSRQNVQRVVNDLVASGAVELRDNPAHERSPLVALTDAGDRQLAELFAASERDRAELLARADVSERQLQQARRTLRRLLDAFAERH